MKNWINTYISGKYLLSVVSGSKFEAFYLYFSAGLVLLLIAYRLLLFAKGNRPPVFKKFDRYWFWGYLTIGVFGLFIWFSRAQALPIFSTRAISYSWLITIICFTIYLGYYYKKKIPAKLSEFYEKKRKSKYLRK